jgi:uncharacterized delta-60 repeat protein
MKKKIFIVLSSILVGFLLVPLEGGRGLAPLAKWVARYDGPIHSFDRARAIAVDGSGNVYVTGASESSASLNDPDYATIKYSPSGTQLWVKRYKGPGNGWDEPCTIAVDGSGNVYITGTSLGSGSNNDYATIKYSPNGKRLWVRRYNGPGNVDDGASAMAVDGSGNVYVTGESGFGDKRDYATIKYSSNGKQLWVRRYNGPNNRVDSACALTVDSSGNVYVTGGSDGTIYLDLNYAFCYATVKYNPNGKQLWASRYVGPGYIGDYAHAIAVDNSGNVYVTGESIGSGTGGDYATIKYNSNGKQLWVRRYNGRENGDDEATAIVVDGSGNVCVTGVTEDWGKINSSDYATIKYSSNGKRLWVRRYDGPGTLYGHYDKPHAMAVDGSGNIYVTGESFGAGTLNDYATVKYDPNGKQLWVKRYNGLGAGYDEAYAIAVDGSGNVYVTGKSPGKKTWDDYATIKY